MVRMIAEHMLNAFRKFARGFDRHRKIMAFFRPEPSQHPAHMHTPSPAILGALLSGGVNHVAGVEKHGPAGITACVTAAGEGARSGSLHRWLPGATCVAPVSTSKSLSANIQLTVTSGAGHGKCGQFAESRCSSWAGSPGPTTIIWPVFSQ